MSSLLHVIHDTSVSEPQSIRFLSLWQYCYYEYLSQGGVIRMFLQHCHLYITRDSLIVNACTSVLDSDDEKKSENRQQAPLF